MVKLIDSFKTCHSLPTLLLRLDLIYWSGSAHSIPFSWYYYGRIETTVYPVHMEPSVLKWQAKSICESIRGALYFPKIQKRIPGQEKEGIWNSKLLHNLLKLNCIKTILFTILCNLFFYSTQLELMDMLYGFISVNIMLQSILK